MTKNLHWITLAVGLAVGYFVLPMVIDSLRGAMAKNG